MAQEHAYEEQTIDEVSRETAVGTYVSLYKKRRIKKRLLTAVVTILALLLVSAAIAAFVLYYQLSHRLSDDGRIHQELSNVLESETVATDPYYILLLGTDGRPGETSYRSDTLLLLRVNPGKKQATIISIPRDTMVDIPGYGQQKINAALAFGGEELAVKTISQFAGVPIAHCIEVNFEGFSQLVDAIGGVEVNVPDRIDDPDAGDYVIEPGVQTLNGGQALAFCRSRAFPDGDYSRMRHQRLFLSALGDKLLNKSDAATMVSSLDAMSKIVVTDMSVSELLGLMKSFRGYDMSTLNTYVVPSTPRMIDGVAYVLTDVQAFKEMMKCINEDKPYTASDEANLTDHEMQSRSNENNPNKSASETMVDVLNGSDMQGMATRAADTLKKAEYQVIEIGNAMNKYDVSVVYYLNENDKKAAESVAARLNIPRVQLGTGLQTNSDVVVVIGNDMR